MWILVIARPGILKSVQIPVFYDSKNSTALASLSSVVTRSSKNTELRCHTVRHFYNILPYEAIGSSNHSGTPILWDFSCGWVEERRGWRTAFVREGILLWSIKTGLCVSEVFVDGSASTKYNSLGSMISDGFRKADFLRIGWVLVKCRRDPFREKVRLRGKWSRECRCHNDSFRVEWIWPLARARRGLPFNVPLRGAVHSLNHG